MIKINRNKLYFGMLLLVLIIVIVVAAYEMLGAGKEEESYRVSVIVDDSNNDRWIALKEGLEQAARDNQIDLNYVFSGKFDSAVEEMELIQREIADGADGVIVHMISDEMVMNDLSEIFSQARVMLIETDVEPQGLYALTGPDNVELGREIGKVIIRDIGQSSSEKRIGILCGNQEQIAMRERLAGVTETLRQKEVQVLWMLEGRNENMVEILAEKEQENFADIIIALGNDETELAVDYLLSGGEDEKKSCLIYGVGCSEKAVYYLDKGLIQSLVVPNEFNMGYLSMEQIAKQLKFHLSGAESSEVDYLVIDRTNLYEEENQKILFPIVQ